MLHDTTVSLTFDLPTDATIVIEGVGQQQSLSAGWTVASITDEPGVVRIVGFGVEELRTAGTLVWLNVRLRGERGDQSPLQVERVRLNEGSPRAQVTSGSVQVGNGNIYLPLLRR